MSRRTDIDQWRRDVFRAQEPKMTAAVKVLLLYLGDHMAQRDRKVSIPRGKIANALGIHEQRLAERFRSAVDAGYLTRVSPGFTGRTAVYQGCWPDEKCVRQNGTQSDPDKARLCTDSREALDSCGAVHSHGGVCTAPRDAIGKADPAEGRHPPLRQQRREGRTQAGCLRRPGLRGARPRRVPSVLSRLRARGVVMTATVIPFPSQDCGPAPCRCPRCQLDALGDRVRMVLEQSAGELLIPREALAAEHADLIATTDLLLPPSEETKP